MVVVLCSLEISFIVCKKRSCFFRGLKLGFGVYDFGSSLPLRLGLAGLGEQFIELRLSEHAAQRCLRNE